MVSCRLQLHHRANSAFVSVVIQTGQVTEMIVALHQDHVSFLAQILSYEAPRNNLFLPGRA